MVLGKDLDTCVEVVSIILLRFRGSHHGACLSGSADRKKWAGSDWFCPIVSDSVPEFKLFGSDADGVVNFLR